MKRASLVLILVLVVVGVSGGEDVSLSELPQSVRIAIERELKGMEIGDIERDEDNGKIVYEAEADGDIDIKIKIAEDGTLLQREDELETKDLPAAILNAVKKIFGDIDIDDVEKRYQHGRKAYYKIEVENDKFEADLEIAEDGTILRKEIDEKSDDDELPREFRRIRRTLLQLIDQLRIVVIGDSRTEKGVDPKYFLGEENQKYPLALSFGSCAGGIGRVQLLCEDYFAHCRKMEWVIYGLSTRVMNKYYLIGGWDDNVKRCDIYYTDKTAWATIPKVTRMIPFSEVDTDGDSSQWGFDGNKGVDDDLLSDKDDRDEALRDLSGIGRFKFDLERLAMLESAIKKLGENNVKMLAFSPPIHPISAGQRCTDDDGTPRESYDEFVTKMNELDKKYPNFYFLDVNKKGEHGLEHECFHDFDHLNIRGAKKLSLMLNDFMKSVDSNRNKGIARKQRQ
ncbi:MAG: PepSY-like domain-containing protein [Planctomycetota bacterium]|jgi:uncharacterized membrane protein YkoI